VPSPRNGKMRKGGLFMQSEALTCSTSSLVDLPTLRSSDDFLPIQRIKNEVAIRLLKARMADESGYDEKVWEIAKTAIDENRLSQRSKFDE
jgi:hypothetical protein